MELILAETCKADRSLKYTELVLGWPLLQLASLLQAGVGADGDF